MSDLGVLKDIARRVAVSIIDFEEFSIVVDNVSERTAVHDLFYHNDDCDYVEPGVYYRLNDCQCANLGCIEDEYFNSLSDVIGRMSVYHQDYFFSDTTEQYEAGELTLDNECDDSNIWCVLCTKLLCSKSFYDLLDDSPCDENISSASVSYEELLNLKDYLYTKEPELAIKVEF